MPLINNQQTIGYIAARIESAVYNLSDVNFTGTANTVYPAGTVIKAAGLAVAADVAAGGAALGILTKDITATGAADTVQVLDINFGFGVVLNQDNLPAATVAMKAALAARGFKFA